MNNAELNQFAKVPTNQTLQRSVFDLSHSNKLTARVGDMIPYECLEIMAGDTITLNQSQLLRSITPAFPTMDNAYVDFFYFFVPYRLCFLDEQGTLNSKIWEQINGENTHSYWANEEEVEAYTESIGEITAQSACDYLGLPIGDFSVADEQFNPACVVAYGLIWNEFFRDQNIENPIVDWFSFITSMKSGILKVNKFHDYFTSALPAPQKGDPVGIGLAGFAPITADSRFAEVGVTDNIESQRFYKGALNANGDNAIETYGEPSWLDATYAIAHSKGAEGGEAHRVRGLTTTPIYKVADIGGINPKADLSQASAISINDLRLAFAAQKMLERDARSGTRYIEMLKARWNITINDETIQRPKYLGGKRIPLNIEQVNQTSETSENSPLGRSGAFSLTTGQNVAFQYSFKEAGYLIGIMCIRLANTYKMGLPKMFSRKNRLDWYNPEFANIGEQSIYVKELYLDPSDRTSNNATFGYKEAWSESRYEQNKLKGKFKDPNELILNSWTYAQNFGDAPTLNSNFLNQSRDPFLKTLAVAESDYDYIVDIYENIKAARPMPTYSIPSLIDHN